MLHTVALCLSNGVQAGYPLVPLRPMPSTLQPAILRALLFIFILGSSEKPHLVFSSILTHRSCSRCHFASRHPSWPHRVSPPVVVISQSPRRHDPRPVRNRRAQWCRCPMSGVRRRGSGLLAACVVRQFPPPLGISNRLPVILCSHSY